MALIAADTTGNNYQKVPAGTHIARCYGVIDLGSQTTNGQYGEKTQRKVKICWEVFGEDENGNDLSIEINGEKVPLTISKNYTLSLSQKATLRKDLAGWRSRDFTEEEAKGFDIQNLCGVYCMLNVTTSDANGKSYTNVASISPLHKSMAKPEPVHEKILFELENFDQKVFDGFYQALKDVVSKSPEYQALGLAHSLAGNKAAQEAANDDLDSDIPF